MKVEHSLIGGGCAIIQRLHFLTALRAGNYSNYN